MLEIPVIARPQFVFGVYCNTKLTLGSAQLAGRDPDLGAIEHLSYPINGPSTPRSNR